MAAPLWLVGEEDAAAEQAGLTIAVATAIHGSSGLRPPRSLMMAARSERGP